MVVISFNGLSWELPTWQLSDFFSQHLQSFCSIHYSFPMLSCMLIHIQPPD
jgi:hypothetical protein